MENTITQRVGLLVENFTGGNKREFSTQIGVSQQGLYNLLVARNGAEPSFKVLSGILRAFPAVSAEWLMTGQGSMLREGRALTPASVERHPATPEPESQAPPVGPFSSEMQQAELTMLKAQLEHQQAQISFLMKRLVELTK